ncbi:hypothetical protein [Pyxidicoccus sp. MSG2]|uniref:hypothetical protein n=1 Tax=Pyxidicoccus sp. MSG2 TaxID=2996790 RepID=UPI0022707A0D|nr:hypothetical protein [Pyxidicoccus sp. MSG2]MCY1023243.1 hypothetical protein [Pyxidicoccus sp. MSG2]
MLLDMYLFFCLPLPSPTRATSKASPRARGGAGRQSSPGNRKPSRQGDEGGQGGKGTRGKRRVARPVLRVIDGGRAGVP